MIPTSVNGHMPFVRDTKHNPRQVVVRPYQSNNCKENNDKCLTLDGSISRIKVLQIRSNEPLDNIPDNIKNNLLTKDRTWYAVVRALFRKGGEQRKRRTSISSNSSDTSSKSSKKSLKSQDSQNIKFSSPINDKPIAGSKTIFAPVKINECSRSKSMRLASIEEEALEIETNIQISMVNLAMEPQALTQMLAQETHNDRTHSLSDHMKRRTLSELIKTHEEVASLSSSTDSLTNGSINSLTEM